MPKSWDTVGRLFFRAPSDKIILNNEFMKGWVTREQLFNPKNIFVAGFPQFDIYKNKKNYLSKENFCIKTNLDLNKPIVLFASEGLWTNWDDVYIDELLELGVVDKYNMVLRPHFSNLSEKKYDRFKGIKGIYVDDQHIRITNMFGDDWDPTFNDMDWLANVINVSDVIITFVSTFVLDVFVYNKPVINIYYDSSVRRQTIPMKNLYNCTHFNAVLKENATSLAKNGGEIISFINEYMQKPEIKKEERQKTVDKLCYLVDGLSSQRISNFLIKNL